MLFFFVQNQTTRLSFLPLQVKVHGYRFCLVAATFSLAGSCSRPGCMTSASWCALLTPLQTRSFRASTTPPEEGEEEEEEGGGGRGHGGGLVEQWGEMLGLEQSNVSQISRSNKS